MSSNMALEGVILDDENLMKKSGIVEVKEWIQKVVEDGSMGVEKLQRYSKRTTDIIEAIEREINNKINLHKTDIDDLRKTLVNIDGMIVEESKRKEKIYAYIENEEQKYSCYGEKIFELFPT